MLARGRIDVYEARGEYQLLVEMLEPQGLGALQLAFEQLKKKLAAEGPVRGRTQASAAALSAAHRHRHFAARRRHRGHGPDSVAPLPGPAHPPVPGAGAGRGLGGRGLPRHRVFQPHEVAGRGDRGPRRGIARRPVDLQRGGRGARHRRLRRAGDLRRGPRDGCDDRRFCGRPARAHALGGGGDGGLHARGTVRADCRRARESRRRRCATAWRCWSGVCGSRESIAR